MSFFNTKSGLCLIFVSTLFFLTPGRADVSIRQAEDANRACLVDHVLKKIYQFALPNKPQVNFNSPTRKDIVSGTGWYFIKDVWSKQYRPFRYVVDHYWLSSYFLREGLYSGGLLVKIRHTYLDQLQQPSKPMVNFSFLLKTIPQIVYREIPKFDKFGQLIENETLVVDLSVANENAVSETMLNDSTHQPTTLELDWQPYVECLKQKVQELGT